MKIIIVGLIAASIITTLALCKAAGEANKALEHPEWIKLRR